MPHHYRKNAPKECSVIRKKQKQVDVMGALKRDAQGRQCAHALWSQLQVESCILPTFCSFICELKWQVQTLYEEAIRKLRHTLFQQSISVIIDTDKESFDPDKEESPRVRAVSLPWCAEDFFQLSQSWEAPRRKQAEAGVGEKFTLLSVNGNRNQLE